MRKRCYVAGCDRYAGWLYWDDGRELDACAEHAGYDDWERMQAEVEAGGASA